MTYDPNAQQPYPPQQAPVPAKRRKWPWIVGGLVLLLVIAGISGGGGSARSELQRGVQDGFNSATAPAAAGATVVYEITGGGKAASVTYSSDGSGSISQEAGVKLPWRKEIIVDRGFAITTVSAQNAGSGAITCRILVDGEVVKEATSTGQYSIVSCTSDPI